MITLSIEKECGCFRKSSHESVQNFDDIIIASKKAKEMCEDMNNKFCHKHKFIYVIEDENIKIKMAINK